MLVLPTKRRMTAKTSSNRLREASDPMMGVLGTLRVAPSPIDSFDDALPIDVGFKVPLEHERGSTYAFTFDCYDETLAEADDDTTVTVVYDFKKGAILDVSPDRPDLSVSGRWVFYPFGPRSLNECWKEKGDDFYRTGALVYSWHGGREDVDDERAAETIALQVSDDEFEALAFQVMRKLSGVAEK